MTTDTGRTEEKFNAAWSKVALYIAMHKKPIWLIPGQTDYFMSLVAPKSDEIPAGTTAWLINPDANGETVAWTNPVTSSHRIPA